jgi:hypothetical protein
MKQRLYFVPVDQSELKAVLTLFKHDKSPGPDGWTVEFFLHFFDLVGVDLLEMVEETRTKGISAGGLNSTFLALIPKVNNPQTFGDYRPISLCNLCYKIITKIIENRLKPYLSKSLSEEKLGFLKGRRIQDAIDTVHECLHSIKRKSIKSMVLKLDLQKAYDCINWDLLRMILIQIGLGIDMTNWIMSCIISSSFDVLLNGEATEFFKSGRGLRQGCPLSPLLFILVMEGLSLLLKESQSNGLLTGIKVSRTIKILHILFVDDVVIMSNATLNEWWEIDKIVKLFCLASGLKVNIQKSTVLHEGLLNQELDPFKRFLPFSFSDLSVGFKYLGYHLKTGMQRIEDWNWMLQKFEKKIGNWCYRWLTLGGHLTLLKSILECQPVYWMSLEIIPNTVLNNLRRIMFNFLWKGNNDTKSFHLCKWESLTLPKKFGGWGLRNLFDFNKDLVENSLWRVLRYEGIWHKVIIDKYLPHTTVKNWFRSPSFFYNTTSRFWRGLMKAIHLITHWLSWSPGSGHLIEIGRDNILGMGENLSYLLLLFLH